MIVSATFGDEMWSQHLNDKTSWTLTDTICLTVNGCNLSSQKYSMGAGNTVEGKHTTWYVIQLLYSQSFLTKESREEPYKSGTALRT